MNQGTCKAEELQLHTELREAFLACSHDKCREVLTSLLEHPQWGRRELQALRALADQAGILLPGTSRWASPPGFLLHGICDHLLLNDVARLEATSRRWRYLCREGVGLLSVRLGWVHFFLRDQVSKFLTEHRLSCTRSFMARHAKPDEWFLQFLPKMPNLTALNLFYPGEQRVCLEYVSRTCPSLSSLVLRAGYCNEVSDRYYSSLNPLEELACLTHLELYDCWPGPSWLVAYLPRLKSLTRLGLFRCAAKVPEEETGVPRSSLFPAEKLPALQRLELYWQTSRATIDLSGLHSCRELVLNCEGDELSGQHTHLLPPLLENLTIDSADFSDLDCFCHALASSSRALYLRSLAFIDAPPTSGDLISLAAFPHLTELRLSHFEPKRFVLPCLEHLAALRRLQINSDSLRMEWLTPWIQRLPLLRLVQVTRRDLFRALETLSASFRVELVPSD